LSVFFALSWSARQKDARMLNVDEIDSWGKVINGLDQSVSLMIKGECEVQYSSQYGQSKLFTYFQMNISEDISIRPSYSKYYNETFS